MLLGTVILVIEDTPDSQQMQAMLVDGPHIFYANFPHRVLLSYHEATHQAQRSVATKNHHGLIMPPEQ